MCTLIFDIWNISNRVRRFMYISFYAARFFGTIQVSYSIYTYMFLHLLHMYVISLHLIICFLMIYFCSCLLHVRVCTFVFLVYMHIYFLLYLHQVFFNTIVVFLYTYMCTYIYILYIHIFEDIYIYIMCMCIYLKNVLQLCL